MSKNHPYHGKNDRRKKSTYKTKVHVTVEVNLCGSPQQASEDSLIMQQLATLTHQLENSMKKIEDILAVVTANTTRIGSLQLAMDGLRGQVLEALADATPAQQARIQAVFDAVTINATALDAALNTNVPPVVIPPIDPVLVAATLAARAAVDDVTATVNAGGTPTQEQHDLVESTEAARVAAGGGPLMASPSPETTASTARANAARRV